MKKKIIAISLLLFVAIAITGCVRQAVSAPTPTTNTDVTIGQ